MLSAEVVEVVVWPKLSLPRDGCNFISLSLWPKQPPWSLFTGMNCGVLYLLNFENPSCWQVILEHKIWRCSSTRRSYINLLLSCDLRQLVDLQYTSSCWGQLAQIPISILLQLVQLLQLAQVPISLLPPSFPGDCLRAIIFCQRLAPNHFNVQCSRCNVQCAMFNAQALYSL